MSIPYDLLTNIPILYTTALSCAYRAFVTTFQAMEAPSFQWERVLRFPGRRPTLNQPKLVPEEFVAEENVNYRLDWAKKVSLAAICLVASSASFGLREN
jgi:hypothetical protein